MERRFSVIVPSVDFENLKVALSKIILYTDFRHSNAEVICSLNGCEAEAKEYIDSLGPHFSYIWSDEKLGVCTAMNMAVAQSKGKYVIKFDDDCVLLPSSPSMWLDMLEAPFDLDPLIGMTGVWLQEHALYNRAGLRTLPKAFVGFLCMVTREIWDRVGGLDEKFNPGLGEDTDFGMAVSHLGYKMSVAGFSVNEECNGPMNFPVWHKSDRWTYGMERYPLYKKNEALLLEKWGNPED